MLLIPFMIQQALSSLRTGVEGRALLGAVLWRCTSLELSSYGIVISSTAAIV